MARYPEKITGLLVLIAILLLVGGFVAGMQYQKQQSSPIPQMTAEIISYSGNEIVDIHHVPMSINNDSFGVFTNDFYVHEKNITAYWVYLRYS